MKKNFFLETFIILTIFLMCCSLVSGVSTRDFCGIDDFNCDSTNGFLEPRADIGDVLDYSIKLDFTQPGRLEILNGEIKSLKLDVEYEGESIGGKFPLAVDNSNVNPWGQKTIYFSRACESHGTTKLTAKISDVIWEDEPDYKYITTEYDCFSFAGYIIKNEVLRNILQNLFDSFF